MEKPTDSPLKALLNSPLKVSEIQKSQISHVFSTNLF